MTNPVPNNPYIPFNNISNIAYNASGAIIGWREGDRNVVVNYSGTTILSVKATRQSYQPRTATFNYSNGKFVGITGDFQSALLDTLIQYAVTNGGTISTPYTAPVISGFTVAGQSNPDNVPAGTVLSAVTLNWSLNVTLGAGGSGSISNGSSTVTLTAAQLNSGTYTFASPVSTTTTFTLNATDGTTAAPAVTCSIVVASGSSAPAGSVFYGTIPYGSGAGQATTAAAALALVTSAVAAAAPYVAGGSALNAVLSYNCTGGAWPFVATPTSIIPGGLVGSTGLPFTPGTANITIGGVAYTVGMTTASQIANPLSITWS